MWLLSCAPEYRTHVVAELDTPRVQVDSTGFPQIYQRDEGAHLHLGVLLPGFASRENLQLAANTSNLTLVGEISNLEAPFSPVGPDNSTNGPFGPFQRQVQLTHPVDITVPVESRMGLGILEFRFQKGPAQRGLRALRARCCTAPQERWVENAGASAQAIYWRFCSRACKPITNL